MRASQWDRNRQSATSADRSRGPIVAQALWAPGFSALVVLLAIIALLAGAITYVVSHDLYGGDQKVSKETQPSPLVTPPNPKLQTQTAPTPEAAPTSVVEPQDTPPTFDPALSERLTDCLHEHRLKYVDAKVYVDSSQSPTRVELTGKVRTRKGKLDAHEESKECLGVENLKVSDRIKIDPYLGEPTSTLSPEPGPLYTPVSPPDPCRKVCQSDLTNCVVNCAPPAVPFSQIPSCVAGCNNAKDHCEAGCGSSGGSEASPPRGGPDEGGPPPD